MKTIHIHVWAHRLGTTPSTVLEALEALRQLLRTDPIARREFFQAAREGWRFTRFSREDRVALVLWAALKEALQKTRERLGVKDRASTLKVCLDLRQKVQSGVVCFPWKSPEGRVYPVFPWDLAERVRPGVTFTHPQYGKGEVLEVKGRAVLARFRAGPKRLALRAVQQLVGDPYAAYPDSRVAEAKRHLERFLASGEEVRNLSRLEREEEFAGNPHFSAGLIAPETVERLGKTGILGIDTLRTRDGKAFASRKPGLWETKAAPDAFESFSVMLEAQTAHVALTEMLQEEGWSVSEVRPHLKKLAKALSPADAKRLFHLLQEIAALRLLKADLHRAGFALTRAVAYRDASGEVVYTAPAYGP
jgi:hypothetical protein